VVEALARSAQEFIEVSESASPRVGGGSGVVSSPGIVVESVADAFVYVETIALIGCAEQAGGGLHCPSEIAIGFRVNGEHRCLDTGDVLSEGGGWGTVERNCGGDFRDIDNEVPGCAATSTEADDADAIVEDDVVLTLQIVE